MEIYRSTMQEEGRLTGFDNVKFFLIVTVVMGHTIDYFTDQYPLMRGIYLFIYTFHMPLFLFISGLFQKRYTERRGLNMERILSLCILGFFLKLLDAAVLVVCKDSTPFELLTGDSVPWFMFAMAAFLGITYILRNLKPHLAMLLCILLGCFVGYDASIGDHLYLSRIVVFLPFYLAGYYLEPLQVLRFARRKEIRILSVVVLAAIICICVKNLDWAYQFRHLLTGRNAFNDWDIAHGGWISRFLCYCITVLSGLAILSLIPNVRIPLISSWGKRTLQVYFWHRGILWLLMYFGMEKWLLAQKNAGIVIILCIPLVLSAVLSLKCFSYPVDYLMHHSFVREKKN